MPISTSEASSAAGLVAALRQRAGALGFDALGIADAASRPDLAEKLATALSLGWHGDMDWMEETAARRASPQALWPEVRSVVMVGFNYAPASDPLAQLTDRSNGNISVYARHRDYHEVVKGKLKDLAGFLARRSGAEVKVFVDTAPVMEKPLAQAAGLGWQGKHTVLVSREFGSWLFLGALFTSAVLPPDTPARQSCGSCRRCLDICPTQAFPGPFQLDARKCLAYWSVEAKGQIPLRFRAAMGNRIYGCDDCLAVCPWNKFATRTREAKLQARPELMAPPLGDLARLDDTGFRALFSGSPVKRLGRDRFVRNVLIAIGNSGDPDLLPHARARLDDAAPLVRGAAIWAVRRLAQAEEIGVLRKSRADEPDPEVAAEWTAPLALEGT